ncbi:gliding motility lipoprotein GldB [Polaribacter pacificus]|uniref:Gliding motility lipoprotein GldB n=1 Tax=Polaribacter pacificus TaxID=1775173 RepID=A0A917HUK1_9FLAO|nr:gliding motility lipoprotein GldB [Polaribacter pacificus]
MFLTSCVNTPNKKSVNIAESIDIELKRFEVDFYTSKPENLELVKQKYPLFFSQNVSDSVWIFKMKDPFEQNLFVETQKKYADFTGISSQLVILFDSIQGSFPDFQDPEVITLVNKLDYFNRVLYSDNTILISLDLYLGSSNSVYANFPTYIKQKFEADYIIVDVVKSIVQGKFSSKKTFPFLEKMIEAGKQQFLINQFLPTLADTLKIGFTEKQLQWAKTNEVFVWTYFNEQQLLQSYDNSLSHRFLETAPFSQFYRVEDSESPGRIAVWIGERIVSSFMQQNDVSLHDLVALAPSEIFTKSKYKPTKYGN